MLKTLRRKKCLEHKKQLFQVLEIKVKIVSGLQINAKVTKKKDEVEAKQVVEGSHEKEELATEKIVENNKMEQVVEVEDKVVSTPRTPGDIEEISIEKSLDQCISEKLPCKEKIIYTHAKKRKVVKW